MQSLKEKFQWNQFPKKEEKKKKKKKKKDHHEGFMLVDTGLALVLLVIQHRHAAVQHTRVQKATYAGFSSGEDKISHNQNVNVDIRLGRI